MKQRLAILGSTGSIGVQTLDIVRENPDFFEVRVLTANSNWQRLAAQAREFDADTAVIADKRYYTRLRDALEDTDVKVYAGEEAVAQVAAGGDTDVAVNALVGYAGLAPTVAALGAGKKLALANKESLVVGGEYVMRLAAEKRAPILPIDSEHSAIFQCLAGEQAPVRRLIITCSGGALRDLKREELAGVTAEQALRHPQWEMGAKITIDSSTLVNKGFEVIEAHWLFGTPAEKISVVLHPQSIVHSMVEFEDGAIKAQLGTPDAGHRLRLSAAARHGGLHDERRQRSGRRGVPRRQVRMARHRARHRTCAQSRIVRCGPHPRGLCGGGRRSTPAGRGIFSLVTKTRTWILSSRSFNFSSASPFWWAFTNWDTSSSVSYTHLTLPTICSV